MNPKVVMTTSLGPVTIELFEQEAPITVKNFLSYTDEGFYDGTIFHRIIPTFMIQGGGFQPGLKQKPTKAAIKNESANGLQNKRGTLAMARTGEPDSATAQFFINTVDNDFLDKAKSADRVGYCVFGKVTDGQDVVDKIKNVQTGNKLPHQNVPLVDVTIVSMKRQ